MSTINRVFLTANLLLLAFILGTQSTPPVEAASSNEINACVNKSSGALRISQKCTKSEQPLSWSKTATGSNGSVVKSKLVTINYTGAGLTGNSESAWPCGQDGNNSLYKGFTYTLKAGSPTRFDARRLADSSWWTLNQTCSITLRVLD
jgi:hypothetical protein